MEKKTGSVLYWAPRILSILFICFLALFSLDIFDMGLGFWETVLGLLVHLIPALAIVAILVVSWRYGLIGGILFILAGTAYVISLLNKILGETPHPWSILTWSLYIAGPAFLIGILFIVGRTRKEKIPKPDPGR